MLPPIPTAYIDYINANRSVEFLMPNDTFPGYVVLWSLGEIEQNNTEYEIERYAPGFIAFGGDGDGDGGGELLVFDKAGAVFLMPAIGMEPDVAIPVSDSFQAFQAQFPPDARLPAPGAPASPV